MSSKELPDLASQREENQKLRAELEEQRQLADVGELAGQVTHKFNNFLNSLLLKIALLETELADAVTAKFAEIKQQAKDMAEVIKQIHQFQRRHASCSQALDLNPLISQLADSLGPEAAASSLAIRLELSGQPALVTGSAVDLQRLCSFLLRNRLIAPRSAGGTVILRTEVGAEKVLFSLQDTGATLSESALANLFEPDAKGQEGPNKLELAVCKSLVRRSQGRIQARPAGSEGMIIEVEFPVTSKPAADL